MRVLRAMKRAKSTLCVKGRTVEQGRVAILEQRFGRQKNTALGKNRKRGEGKEHMKFLNQEAQINALTRGIDFNTGGGMNDTGFKGLMGTIKQVAGAYYQTKRAVRTVKADKDAPSSLPTKTSTGSWERQRCKG